MTRPPDALEEDEKPATADFDSLRGFIEDEVLPWIETRRQQVANRPVICDQAYGESLDPDRLERLGCYEVHLGRKLERTPSMLLKLKDLRQGMAAN